MNTPNGTATIKARLGNGRSGVQRGVLLTGVLFIFGGEGFCLLGPIRYARVVHVVCHIVFYAGVVLVCLGAVLNWAGMRGSFRRPPESDV